MSEKIQTTMDGKPAPPPSSSVPKKKNPTSGGSSHTHFDQQRRREQLQKKSREGPRTPAQERKAQENQRIKEATQKLACLVDWHDTCPASQVFPPSSQEEEIAEDTEPQDEHRYLSTPPKTIKSRRKEKQSSFNLDD